MRSPTLVTLAPLVLVVGLLTGCTAGDNQTPSGTTPEAVDPGALLVALEEVAPGLGDDGSVTVADAVCKALDDGEDSDAVDELALEQLGPVADGELTIDQAQSAVRVIATQYCE
ncbi:hypothetical protein ACFSBZ_11370 [Amnibacterium flavum]|uniref:DUF732 domain-containing protein n=1 Tax=Amnibacterium flavum TaxID=2173173 RepID=A0A2V1HW88_9MICO|nr:hypothetical protein [Amnibacterium flavum]PVZ95419.1 hypothetical protein DDQ50_02590 [Amnibacterium flavum]